MSLTVGQGSTTREDPFSGFCVNFCSYYLINLIIS
uniref:Uncharacterized protein n=1 Tax=Anguilla anguilla TaxID=7936 RepID=A0A0E9VKH0_ANGAN